jgi:hypothetical protein
MTIFTFPPKSIYSPHFVIILPIHLHQTCCTFSPTTIAQLKLWTNYMVFHADTSIITTYHFTLYPQWVSGQKCRELMVKLGTFLSQQRPFEARTLHTGKCRSKTNSHEKLLPLDTCSTKQINKYDFCSSVLFCKTIICAWRREGKKRDENTKIINTQCVSVFLSFLRAFRCLVDASESNHNKCNFLYKSMLASLLNTCFSAMRGQSSCLFFIWNIKVRILVQSFALGLILFTMLLNIPVIKFIQVYTRFLTVI